MNSAQEEEHVMEGESPSASAPQSGRELGAFVIFSIVLILLGQTLFGIVPNEQRLPLQVEFYAGLTLFVIGAWSYTRGGKLPHWLSRGVSIPARALGLSISRFLVLLMAPVLSYGAWFAAGEQPLMRVPWLAVGLWLLAIICVVVVAADRRSQTPRERWPRWEIALLFLIIAIAAITRVPDLTQYPWILTGDEGKAGLSALEFLNGTRNNIFNTAWDSWPSLYLILPASSIRFLGQTTTALRMPSPIAGVLTVLLLYLLARSMFGRPIALAAAAYLSVFHFHIHFSRLAIPTVWDGFFFTLFSLGFYLAWKHNNRLYFALAGLVFGLSMFFYASARSLMLVLPIWLLAALVKDRAGLKARLSGLVTLGIGAITVFLPLGVFYIHNPDEYFAPLRRFGITPAWVQEQAINTGHSALVVMLGQFRDSILAFTGTNLRYWYLIDHPMLLPIAATLFLLGIVLLVLAITRLENLWLLLWMGAGVLAGALSDSTPAAQRYVFTAPAVATVVAIGLTTPLSWFARIWPRWRVALVWLGVVTLAVAGAADLDFYFLDYSASLSFGDGNTVVAQEVADYLMNDRPPNPVYFAGSPRMSFTSHGSLPYLAYGYTGFDVTDPPDDWEQEHGKLSPPFTFIALPDNRADLAWVQDKFPGGETLAHASPRDGFIFWSYVVH